MEYLFPPPRPPLSGSENLDASIDGAEKKLLLSSSKSRTILFYFEDFVSYRSITVV